MFSNNEQITARSYRFAVPATGRTRQKRARVATEQGLVTTLQDIAEIPEEQEHNSQSEHSGRPSPSKSNSILNSVGRPVPIPAYVASRRLLIRDS